MNYYIADLHLHHGNIVSFNRATHLFSNVEEMDQTIISNWNNLILPNDVVYILGDFNWETESSWVKDLRQLKGKKVLVRGNHDLKHFTSKAKNLFVQVVDYLEVTEFIGEEKYKVILSHYPMLSFNKDYSDNVIHLFGHVHQHTDEAKIVREYIRELRRLKNSASVFPSYVNKGNMVNVGACCPWMNYTPQPLEYLLNIIKTNTDLL